jgi:uncharacterized protein (DUF1501 family)
LTTQLIKAGLTTSVYYTRLNGFDTHSGQLTRHASLMRELGASLQAFLDDGDAIHAINFRRADATVLYRLLGVPHRDILGTAFESMPLLHG